MPVGTHVERNAVEVSGEVGTVVEIEAAQKILVGLAGAGVLGGDHSGHGFDQFADPQQWRQLEVGIADKSFRGSRRRADMMLRTPVYEDFLDDLIPEIPWIGMISGTRISESLDRHVR